MKDKLLILAWPNVLFDSILFHALIMFLTFPIFGIRCKMVDLSSEKDTVECDSIMVRAISVTITDRHTVHTDLRGSSP